MIQSPILGLTCSLLLSLLCPAARAGSETPPEGPTWVRTIEEARELALAANKPIFVYFTKTY